MTLADTTAGTQLLAEVGVAPQPILFRSLLKHAVPERQCLSWLADRLGRKRISVEYSLHGCFRPQPRLNGGRYFTKVMSFEDAATRIAFPGHYAVNYYIAGLDVDESLPELSNSLPAFRDCRCYPPKHRVFFLGNTGSGSHLHYDLPYNVLLVLCGHKTVRLLPPALSDAARPYDEPSNCRNMSRLEKHELRDLLSSQGTTLECAAGDALYVPRGWWHQILNRGFTMSVSHVWPVPPECAPH
jgi:hypothetical protein